MELLCGYAMRCLPSLFCEGEYEEIPGNGIEVKAWSEDCLAECVAGTRGDDAYL